MTLTELIPEVERLSSTDKVKLIRLLAENLDIDDISPLEANKTYHLYTPYGCQGAGTALMSVLKSDEPGTA